MKIGELKAILKEIPESDDQLDVCVIADHGQDLEIASDASMGYCSNYVIEEIHPDDLLDHDGEYHRVFIISGD